MKKLLLLLMFIPLVSLGQLTYEEKNTIAAEVFDTFSDDYIKKSVLTLVKLDDKAIASANKKYPNPKDWEKQIDFQREIENTDRLNWYKKQNWWKKVNKNADIAYYVRAKIIGYSYDKGWLDNI